MNHNRTRSFSNTSNYSFMTQNKNCIEQIEKDVNKLCWLYDSVMPILEISHYMPSFQRWQSQLKSIDQRICHKEKQLRQYKKRQEKQKQSLFNQPQGLKFQYETCFKMLSDLQQQIGQLSKNRHSIELKKYQQNVQVNQFKKKLETSVNRTKKFLDGIFQKDNLKYPPIKNTTLQPYEDIMMKIQQLKGQLPDSNLLDFHTFNFKRLSGQIQSINERLENMFRVLLDKSNFSPQQLKDEAEEIDEEIQDIEWQLKGLSKKYLRQIDFAYVCPQLSTSFTQEQKQQYFLKTLEKHLSVDIQNLQEKIRQTKKKNEEILKITKDPNDFQYHNQ